MEDKLIVRKSKIVNEDNKVNIIDFIEGSNEDNYYEMLICLLEHENLVEGKTIRKHLETTKPIVDNEYFSVHNHQLEHISIIPVEGVKTEYESTFLIIYCIKSKGGELFNSKDECQEKLYQLSKDCFNLQKITNLYCSEDNMRLFSCCSSVLTENEEKRYSYFTAMAFTLTGNIH
jgi:hypothetical protein